MGNDNSLGPALAGTLDFTILFEQSILTLLPTSLFILVATWRITRLMWLSVCVKSKPLGIIKLITASAFTLLEVILLVLWSLPHTPHTKASAAQGVVGILGAATIIALSHLEHYRSIKPSLLLNFYLLLTAILDLAQIRTLYLRSGITTLAGVSTTTLVVKVILLVLEEMPKQLVRTDKCISLETRAGFISRTVFWWLNRFIILGSGNVLNVSDIGTIQDKLEAEKLLPQLQAELAKGTKIGKYHLMKSTLFAYKAQFFAGVIPRLLFSGFSFAQPFLINTIIKFVSQSPETRDSAIGKALVGATILVYLGIAFSSVWYKHATFQLVTMYRGGLVALIYRKTLEISPDTAQDSAPVTLMSTDVEGIALGFISIHDIWASIFELPVALYLLYDQIGAPGLFILIPAIITTLSGLAIAPNVGPAMVLWNSAVEKRVGETSSMLNQIKGVKMMGLTKLYGYQLRKLRSAELALSTKFRWLLVYLNTTSIISGILTPVIVLIAAIFWTKADQGLSVETAFTSLSIITIATEPITTILGSLMDFFRVIGCFTRLQTFLTSPSRVDHRMVPDVLSPSPSASSAPPPPPSAVPGHAVELSSMVEIPQRERDDWILKFSDATFTTKGVEEVLHKINMKIRTGTMSAVVGRVGCGKSCLLKAIIGELPLQSGIVESKVCHAAYCDQKPWITNASIKNNIVGQSRYDEQWLATVLHACALDEDMQGFSSGINTVAGSRGVALSGGQKQRVALARAVYTRLPLVILDDVFSGLDNKTSRTIFQRLLHPSGLLRKSGQTVVLATHDVKFLAAADYITMLEAGRIVRNQVPFSSMEISTWGIYNKGDLQLSGSSDSKTDEQHGNIPAEAIADDAEHIEAELARQTGDWECYKIYIKSMGLAIFLPSLAFIILFIVLESIPQILLRLWTEHGTTEPNALGYMIGYVGTSVLSIIAGIASFGFFIILGITQSANKLHSLLLEAVIWAPFNFFTKTDNGVTLNRFSQDMSLIDQSLPMHFYATAALIAQAIADAAIIASGSSYIGATLPVCIVIIYFIQRYYLRTSRQIRFLDLEMKSPLYTHFTETIEGLSTIRALGWATEARLESNRRLNTSQKPYYTMFCIQRWLQVVLDLLVMAIAVLLVTFAIAFPSATSSGAIGLAMINVVTFSFTLKTVVTAWTQLETSLGAIARLKWFINNTPKESKEREIVEPPVDWPSRGRIELRDVVAAYGDHATPILRGLSLTVLPGQKVGVCGRSGSGKSSLILTLARLLELQEDSSINIDDVELSTVPRETIRSRIIALPQDAIRLAGTIRNNLDLEGLIQNDELLIEALTKTTIWPVIQARGGLDAILEELNFSAGQLQLFCLSRVLLRSRSSHLSCHAVILLDEATSSVDRQTDSEVRAAISPDLEGITVIEVAHHLDIVRNYDVIVVMKDGKVAEMGKPDELLARPNSEFQELWANRNT